MFWAAVRKDVQLLRRDRGALAGLFVLPVLFIAVFGHVLSDGPEKKVWPVAVFAAPEADRAAEITAALDGSGHFHVVGYASADAVRSAVADRQVRLGVILPADFAPLEGRPAELVIDEAGAGALRAPLEGALSSIIGAALVGRNGPLTVLEARTPPQIKRTVRHVDGFQLAVPGNAVLFCFFLAVTVALSFIGERRTGTWRRLLAAPVPRRTLLVAKLVPYFLVGLVQMALFFAVGVFAFGMKVGGSPIALVLLTVAVCLCAVSLGLLLATFARTEKQVGGVGSLLVLTMGLVGGCMYPRIAMPDLMQSLGLGVPHAWALDGYYEILIREGATVSDVAVQLGALTGFAALFIAIGIARFRFED